MLTSPLQTYQKVAENYDKIDPYRTTEKDLKELNIYLYAPNTRILNYLTIEQRFLHHPNIKKENLPYGVQKFLEAKENGKAYEITPYHTKTRREGTFILDFSGIKRLKRKIGWTFKGLILLAPDPQEKERMVVVYKLPPEGTPNIDHPQKAIKPLGNLQEGFGGLINTARDLIWP